MILQMFVDIADEIFSQADVRKEGNEELHEQCVSILSSKMAWLSTNMGLSMKRVTLFEKQKASLIDDLLKMKAEGKIS